MNADETPAFISFYRRLSNLTQNKTLSLLLLLGIVILIRLPFLTQAIQGDDPYYLFGAQYALMDPAHPSHAKYIFHGELVDMRGHPHPPLNSWILAALIALFGDVYEVPFHAVYVLFSLIAVAAMWSLARRWSPHPFLATLMLIAVPTFVVNGTSLESDVPFLAWWLAGIALFVSGRSVSAAIALALAAMTSYQAVVVTPILWAWCWWHKRHARSAWAVSLTPVVVVIAYQIYERLTSGALPATVLAGYFSSYGLQQIANKLKNAAALTAHTGWLVFPLAAAAAFRRNWPVFAVAAVGGFFIDNHPLFWVSFAIGAMALVSCTVRKPDFLSVWVALFFAAALILFFAGSARYLLPMAAPVILLVSRELKAKGLAVAMGANLVLGLCLAWVNWQHWDGYRQFVRSVPDAFGHSTQRTWINGELGIRFYAESEGALPIASKQPLQEGEWVLSSDLGFPVPITAPLSPVRLYEIRPTFPLRTIGLGSKSGYSTASFGLRPFDFSTEPVDRVRAQIVRKRNVSRSWLPMNSPEAEEQILSGIYQLEGDTRWMSGRGILLLARPPVPQSLEIQIYVPDSAPARSVLVMADGIEIKRQALPGPGIHTVRSDPVSASTITIEVDQTFRVPGDYRDLGAVLIAAGYR